MSPHTTAIRAGCRAALLIASLLAPLAAQDPLADALAGFERVRSAPEAERAAALTALAAFSSPEITDLLLAELTGARTAEYRMQVIGAIGAATRPGVLDPLADLLVDGGTDRELREACAGAIARQGNQGIDLLGRLSGEPPGTGSNRGEEIRRASLVGLAKVGEDRARRILAERALEGNVSERVYVLRLLAPAGNTSSVQRARERCLKDPDLQIASLALRQLVEHGYRNGERAVLQLLERVEPGHPQRVRVALVESMLIVGARSLYEPLLRLAASGGEQMLRSLGSAGALVGDQEDLLTWLAERGLRREVPEQRLVARRILESVDRETRWKVLQSTVRRVRSPAPADAGLIVDLHSLMVGDEAWAEVLLNTARSSNPGLRAVGLDLLAASSDRRGLPLAHRNLSHPDWTVRAAAYDYCARVRDVGSIPLLLRRFDEESGRLREDLLDALEALTGRRYFFTERWSAWWEENREGFELPPVAAARQARPATGGGNTFSYYQIPLVSERVVFVVDVSGSMRERFGTGGGLSRLAEAKRQLRLVLDQIEPTVRFDIIRYEGKVTSLLRGLENATPDVKAQAAEAVDRLWANGATNVFDAIELAFDYPEVDTIYLLTDGEPTTGRIVDPQLIADEVRRWNRTRRVRIHSIAVGVDRAWMKRLADESGGTYVYVR